MKDATHGHETTDNYLYRRTRNYLKFKLGYSVEKANKIIKRFGIANGVDFCKDTQVTGYHDRLKESLNISSEYIQSHWNDFMEFYGNIKHEYANNKSTSKWSRRNKNYNDSDFINDALKYTNGSTDDF